MAQWLGCVTYNLEVVGSNPGPADISGLSPPETHYSSGPGEGCWKSGTAGRFLPNAERAVLVSVPCVCTFGCPPKVILTPPLSLRVLQRPSLPGCCIPPQF